MDKVNRAETLARLEGEFVRHHRADEDHATSARSSHRRGPDAGRGIACVELQPVASGQPAARRGRTLLR